MNSEMIGIPTDVPFAFVFMQVDGIPRHPAQMYEALYCLVLFALAFYLWRYKRNEWQNGALAGLVVAILFSLRFLDEFFKVNQESFEEGMLLNMGQILSIPFILIGIIALVLKWRSSDCRTTS